MNDQIEFPEEEIVEEIQEISEGEGEVLELSTLEPVEEVERTGDFKQSEAIEAAVVEVVEVQAFEVRHEGEDEPAAEVTERGVDLEIQHKAVEEKHEEVRQPDDSEETPELEVVQVEEIPLEVEPEEPRAEAPDQTIRGEEPAHEPIEIASTDGRIMESDVQQETDEGDGPAADSDASQEGK